MGQKKYLGQKEIWVRKNFRVQNDYGSIEKFLIEKDKVQKFLGPKKLWGQKFYRPKNILCPI